jgi:hypothetical protein
LPSASKAKSQPEKLMHGKERVIRALYFILLHFIFCIFQFFGQNFVSPPEIPLTTATDFTFCPVMDYVRVLFLSMKRCLLDIYKN